MNVIPTTIPDVLILEPRLFGDQRGFFMESYNQNIFNQAVGRDVTFVQDNHSRSEHGALRGLHYQIQKPQAKLVRVIQGTVFDVVVDMRRSSPTFGKWFGTELSSENKRQLWAPEGFAHGFVVLSQSADCLYKTTEFYAPEFEQSVIWDDLDLQIDWPFDGTPILSNKDKYGTPFCKAITFP